MGRAWDKLQTNSYDCVILDLKMPGMSGEELYRLIERSDRAQASKIIFVTGDIASQDTSRFISETGNHSMSKPFNINEFRDLVFRSVARGKVDPNHPTGLLPLNVFPERIRCRTWLKFLVHSCAVRLTQRTLPPELTKST